MLHALYLAQDNTATEHGGMSIFLRQAFQQEFLKNPGLMRIVIIEDESAAVKRLQQLLSQLDVQHTVIASLPGIAEAVQWFSSHPHPDVVLLDIHLADGSGFELFHHLDLQCPVIFTTAYNEYAVEAFRHAAIDYLLKPIKSTELEEALSRVSPKMKQTDAQNPPAHASGLLARLRQSGLLNTPKRTLVKIGHTIRIMDLNTPAYYYTQDKMTYAVTAEGKRLPVDHTLEELEHTLDASRYFRINRQIIVCIEAIEEMYPYSKSRLKIMLKPAFTQGDAIVSSERSAAFKTWVSGNPQDFS